MWLKTLGGVLLVTAAVTDLMLHARQMRRTERCVRAWVALLQMVQTQISCLSTPLPDILRTVPPQILRDLTQNASADVQDLSELCRVAAERLPTEIGARLRSLSDEIGRVWREEQLERLGQEIRALEQEAERLHAQLAPSIRLRGTLSVCGALAVMLLIW